MMLSSRLSMTRILYRVLLVKTITAAISFNKPRHPERSVRESSKTSGAFGFRWLFLFLFWRSKKEKKVPSLHF